MALGRDGVGRDGVGRDGEPVSVDGVMVWWRRGKDGVDGMYHPRYVHINGSMCGWEGSG